MNKKIYSVVLTMMIFVITSQITAPTFYNASEVKEISINQINQQIESEIDSNIKYDLNNNERVRELALNNLSCSLVHKQLNIDRYSTKPLQQQSNYHKTRTIKVGAICHVKLMRTETVSGIISELYGMQSAKNNNIFRVLSEEIQFKENISNNLIKLDSLKIKKYSRPRDGPIVVDYAINQGRRL